MNVSVNTQPNRPRPGTRKKAPAHPRGRSRGRPQQNRPPQTTRMVAVPMGQSQSEPAQLRVPRVILDCLSRYAAVLADPWIDPGGEICAPNMWSTNSSKMTTRAILRIGVRTSAVNGQRWASVQYNPWQMFARTDGALTVEGSSGATHWINAPLVGTTTDSSSVYLDGFKAVSAGFKGALAFDDQRMMAQTGTLVSSDSPYDMALTLGQNLGQGSTTNWKSPWEFRLVAAGVRIRFTGQAQTLAGTIVGYRDPQNSQMGGPGTSLADSLKADGAAISVGGIMSPTSYGATMLTYKPFRDSDHSYQRTSLDYFLNGFDPSLIAEAEDARHMGFFVRDPPADGSFMVEAIAHFEFRAPNIAQTPTPSAGSAATQVATAVPPSPMPNSATQAAAMAGNLARMGLDAAAQAVRGVASAAGSPVMTNVVAAAAAAAPVYRRVRRQRHAD